MTLKNGAWLFSSSSSELLQTLCCYLFVKNTVKVVALLAGAPLTGSCHKVFFLYVRDRVCSAHFVVLLQLSGFITAAGVGMLATRGMPQSTLLPGTAWEGSGQADKDFSV